MLSFFVALGSAAVLAAAHVNNVFTAEDMVSAPRPQPAIASPDKSHALAIVDQWDSKHDSTTRSVYLLSLDSTATPAPIQLFSARSSEISEVLWLTDDIFAYLNRSSLYSVPIDTAEWELEKTRLLDFPAGVNPSGLQYEPKSDILAYTGMVWGDGAFEDVPMYDEAYEKRGDTGLVFDELLIRHLDTWRTPGKVHTLGLTKLEKVGWSGEQASMRKPATFYNILNDTGLQSQMDPISSFSISSTHIAFVAMPSYLNPAWHSRQDVYLLPLELSSKTKKPSDHTLHAHGEVSSLAFSPDGKKLAWLETAEDTQLYDNAKLVVLDISKTGPTTRWTRDWDRNPEAISWAVDSDSIYLLAQHEGRTLPYHITHPNHLPTPLYFNGTTESITPLSATSMLLSISTITSPVDDFTLDLDSPDVDGDKLPRSPLHRMTDWSSKHLAGRIDGMEGEEFWFEGAEGWRNMGWIVKPRGWSERDAAEGKLWPMIFWMHGGPQGVFPDAWSTRWNEAVFASQGYFVIAINPTGSTGYGEEFSRRSHREWGGRAFKDLLSGYHEAMRLYPEIDPDRTAAIGSSYGGFMANWINGNNIFGFKALISHDGMFNTVDLAFTTDEAYYPASGLGEDVVHDRLIYEKWNPMNHVAEWSTPQLVIHGGLDFRLDIGQGIGTFTALQMQGVPSRFLTFPDEGHYVMKPANSLRWHHEVFRWLEEWIGKGKIQEDEAAFVVEN